MSIKPNTTCKNPNCKHGKDGERKHYYTCYSCINVPSWRSVACCPECFQEYLEAIEKNHQNVDKSMIPDRTDMSKKEILDFQKNTTKEEALEKSKEELKEYKDEIEAGGIAMAVEQANKDLEKIDQQKKTRKRTTKKKSN